MLFVEAIKNRDKGGIYAERRGEETKNMPKIKLIKQYRTIMPGIIFEETQEKCDELVRLGLGEIVKSGKKTKEMKPAKKKRGYKTK